MFVESKEYFAPGARPDEPLDLDVSCVAVEIWLFGCLNCSDLQDFRFVFLCIGFGAHRVWMACWLHVSHINKTSFTHVRNPNEVPNPDP